MKKKLGIRNEGITLVALVVTVIVLLILVGVSINLVAGSNGIMNRATKAVDVAEVARMKEDIELKIAEMQMDYYSDYTNQNGTVREYVQSKLEEGVKSSTGATISCDENSKIKYNDKEVGILEEDGRVTMNGEQGGTSKPIVKEYTVSYNGNGGNGVPTDTRKYKEGETVTVDFGTTPTRERYTFQGWARTQNAVTPEFTNSGSFTVSGNTTLYAVWTGVTGKGTDIIEPAWYGDKVNYSANGVDDWKVFLNNGSNIFIISSDYVPRSKMTMTSDVIAGNGDYCVGGTIRDDFVNWLQTASNWINFKGTYAEIVTGGPMREQFWKSYNTKYGTNYLDQFHDLSEEAGYNETLYFPHKAVWNECYGYWLASPNSDGSKFMSQVEFNGEVDLSGYNCKYPEFGIRPFVSLLSDVKMTWTGGSWELSN